MHSMFCQRNNTYRDTCVFGWALFLPVDVGTTQAKINLRNQPNPEIVEYNPINCAYEYIIGLLN